MTIPKIIWAIWCDFGKKSDGNLVNNDTNFFINRITSLHDSSWRINIITEWDVLVAFIGENEMLMNLLNNNFISPAHKSDAIRYFLLQKYGGFWVDINTFLVQSFDYLITDKVSFICYYAPSIDIEEWMLAPLSSMYENTDYDERIQTWGQHQKQYIDLKPNFLLKYNFIPENYFIAVIPNHPIIINTFNQLTNFWEKHTTLIVSSDDVCNYLNNYIKNLCDTVFKISYSKFNTVFETHFTSIFNSNKLQNFFNKQLWDCGYLFNYIQLYISITNYLNKNEHKRTYMPNKHPTKTIAIFKKYKTFCNNNNCNDIKYTILHDNTNILLLSASYNRLGKWSNIRNNRLSWENTYLGKLISSIENKDQAEKLIELFKNEKFNHFKFGSYTRNSPIIKILKMWYDNTDSDNISNKIIPVTNIDTLQTKYNLLRNEASIIHLQMNKLKSESIKLKSESNRKSSKLKSKSNSKSSARYNIFDIKRVTIFKHSNCCYHLK